MREKKLRRNTNFTYFSYNKFIVKSQDIREIEILIRAILRYFERDITSYDIPHHLILQETISKHRYAKEFLKDERVEASLLSGVEEPSVLTVSNSLQAFTLYDEELKIANKTYLGPFSKIAEKRYRFFLVDSLKREGVEYEVLYFSPKYNLRRDKLSGLILYNKSKNFIEGFWAQPSYESGFQTRLLQSYKDTDQGLFPMVSKTDIYNTKERRFNIDVGIENTTFHYALEDNLYYTFWDFDNIIYEYSKDSQKDSVFWSRSRPVSLNQLEKNTYHYYDSVGTIKSLERYTQIGERLVLGRLKVGSLDLPLNELISYNEHEGLRLGFGFNTNDKISSRYSLGAFTAYGLEDGELKGGVRGALYFDDNKKHYLNFYAGSNKVEAANDAFRFYRKQYSSESLRKYRVSLMDRYNEIRFGAVTEVLQYVKAEPFAGRVEVIPQYEYGYKENFNSSYFQNQLGLNLYFAFGEKYLKIHDDLVSVGTSYPKLYFRYTRNSGNFNFSKYEARVQYDLKIRDYGTLGINMDFGYLDASAPYPFLFNANGSLRDPSVVIHNSFETAGFNEFLADRLAAVHLAYNFGRFYFLKGIFQPSPEILTNMGWGTLRVPENHSGFEFSTLERGFYESGIFLNDLVTQKLFGLNAGFGTGFFFRYGPYRKSELGDNWVWKLSLGFNL